MATITIKNAQIAIKDLQGNIVESIYQKFNYLKSTFRIFNPSGGLIVEINGD